MRYGLLVLVWCATAACSIDESGLMTDGGVDSPPPPDGSMDVVEEPFVCADAGIASCEDAAPFRFPALYSPDAGAPCPSGYETYDLTNTTPNAATCECQCGSGGTPSCDTTTAHLHAGATDCSLFAAAVSLSGCTAAVFSLTAGHFQVDPPAVTGGCTGGTAVAPSSTNTNVRLCVPTCISDESVCTSHGGLQACVYAAGNVGNCPPGYPSGPFFVGASPSVKCDPCSCTETGDCTHSTFDYYASSNNCTSGSQSANMDGTCNPVVGVSYQSAQVVPTLINAACSVTPTSAQPAYGSNPFTVCCQ